MRRKKFHTVLIVVLTLAVVGTTLSLLSTNFKRSEDNNFIPYRFSTVVPPPNLEQEIAFYEQRLKTHASSAMDHASLAGLYLKKARVSRDQSWYDKAEQLARRSLEILPMANTESKLVLASVAQARHEFLISLGTVQEVLQEKPQSAQARALLVTIYLGLGKIPEASQAAEALVKKIPSLGSLTLRALVRLGQGREEEALRDFHQALLREDLGEVEGSAYTRTLLGRFHGQHGEKDLARKYFQEALRIRPENPLALGLLAELEGQAGEYDAAERLYVRAFQVSGEPSYVVDRAKIKVLRADLAGAEELRRQAGTLIRQELSTGKFGHRGELAHLLLDWGRPQDLPEILAITQEEARLRRDPETLDTLAWALSRAGRWREAQGVMREALSSGIQSAEYFFRAGMIERALANPVEARDYFEKALAVNPRYAEATEELVAFR